MKFIFPTFLFVFCCAVAHAQNNTAVLDAGVSGGYQSASFRWSIAGNMKGQSPNTLSEVKWHGVSGPLFDSRLQVNFSKRWFLGGSFAKCFIGSGQVTDNDYADDNRQNAIYTAQLDGDEGDLLSYQFYGGFNFLSNRVFKFSVLAGYLVKGEHLFLLKHAEDIPGQKNLHTSYETDWKGCSAGVMGSYTIIKNLRLSATLLYSQMNYHASADWNLIDAFRHPVSFKQRAKGFDMEASASCIYQVSRIVSLFASGTYDHAETGNGVDDLFLDSGDMQATQFNGAVKNVSFFTIGTAFHF